MTTARYNEEEFWASFKMDLKNAKGRVIIQSAFVSPWRIKQLSKNLHDLFERGVTVCAFVQEPYSLNGAKSNIHKLEENMTLDEFNFCLSLLSRMGVHVNTRQGTHQEFAIIDDRIVYEGSLNILSHNRTQENMLRSDSVVGANKAIKKNQLDECQDCVRNLEAYSYNVNALGLMGFGTLLEQRRKSLGLSQRELALRCKLGQKQVLNAERGKNVAISSILGITSELGLKLVFVPDKHVSALANFLGNQST